MERKRWQQIWARANRWRVGILPGGVVIAAIGITRCTGALQFLEWAAFDTYLRLRPAEPIDERVLIVGIQEDDIQRVGRYPIPDRDIAKLLNTLQTHQPTVIGLDIVRDLPVEPGHADLIQTFRRLKTVIAVDKVVPDRSNMTVKPPPSVPPDRIGSADAIFDADGKQRRSLLGTATQDGGYRLSLAIQLAQRYLAPQGLTLENGIRDRNAMRFGATEFTQFQPNSGSYVGADAGGNQILINFRSGRQPFRTVSMQDVLTGAVNPEWIRGRIVLVGITAPSVKDVTYTAAVVSDNPALIYGVEAQAHMVSQLVSAVLDQRSLINGWTDVGEYLWIAFWGVVGISLGRRFRFPLVALFSLVIVSLCLIAGSYGLLLLGWWVPVVPALLVLFLNGAGPAAIMVYRHEQELRSRLRERQAIIEQTFNAIHNGPLQTLAKMLRQAHDEEIPPHQLLSDLQHLNRELRVVYESMQQEVLAEDSQFHLSHDRQLDLQIPLHESLYEVYRSVLERDFPHFKGIKVQVVKFESLDDRHLDVDQKRGLCRFLEEALCNVGKHATNVTRLEVTCMQIRNQNVIRVADNGVGLPSTNDPSKPWMTGGLGTRQAKNLAKQLSGQFQRSAKSPHGTVCELTWPVTKFWLRKA